MDILLLASSLYMLCHHVHGTKGVHGPLALHLVTQCPATIFSTSTVWLPLPFLLPHNPCILRKYPERTLAGCQALLEPRLWMWHTQSCCSPPMSMRRCR